MDHFDVEGKLPGHVSFDEDERDQGSAWTREFLMRNKGSDQTKPGSLGDGQLFV